MIYQAQGHKKAHQKIFFQKCEQCRPGIQQLPPVHRLMLTPAHLVTVEPAMVKILHLDGQLRTFQLLSAIGSVRELALLIPLQIQILAVLVLSAVTTHK